MCWCFMGASGLSTAAKQPFVALERSCARGPGVDGQMSIMVHEEDDWYAGNVPCLYFHAGIIHTQAV
jgi:hypothetical protein